MNGSDSVVVGVADMAIAREGDGRLVTYALGSCIGLSLFDPVARIGGLLHFMLPSPAEQADPKTLKAYQFASTGVPLLLRKLTEAGASANRLIVCAAGGAETLPGAASLEIGKRNRAMLRKVLWKVGLALAAEDTGGVNARTMSLDLTSGTVSIRTRDDERVLWTPGNRVRAVNGVVA